MRWTYGSRSNLMHALTQIVDAARAARMIADHVAVLIDGYWLRHAKSDDPVDAAAAIAHIESSSSIASLSEAREEGCDMTRNDVGGATRGAAPAACRSRAFPCRDPGPGELLLKLETSGICHTDLHVADGQSALPVGAPQPLTLGHEGIGRVVEQGPGHDHASRHAAGSSMAS